MQHCLTLIFCQYRRFTHFFKFGSGWNIWKLSNLWKKCWLKGLEKANNFHKMFKSYFKKRGLTNQVYKIVDGKKDRANTKYESWLGDFFTSCSGRIRGKTIRIYCRRQGFGSGFWPNSDPGLCASNEGRILKFYCMIVWLFYWINFEVLFCLFSYFWCHIQSI